MKIFQTTVNNSSVEVHQLKTFSSLSRDKKFFFVFFYSGSQLKGKLWNLLQLVQRQEAFNILAVYLLWEGRKYFKQKHNCIENLLQLVQRQEAWKEMDAGLSPKLGHLINYLSHLSFSKKIIFTVECDINRNADFLFPEALSNPSGVSGHFVTYNICFFFRNLILTSNLIPPTSHKM